MDLFCFVFFFGEGGGLIEGLVGFGEGYRKPNRIFFLDTDKIMAFSLLLRQICLFGESFWALGSGLGSKEEDKGTMS